ncbi:MULTISPECIES: amidase family protein [unclassified Rhizobium]|uniref:amidase n=1 Tax=unclassified Rhizobium TaxID=2613769 RepID=UPI0006F4E8E0|nr:MULTISPECIES: amidase family protein [unclassified Rhizobium]KQV39369.1 amidase [Rhizobium sp. Root1212]KRD35374.1 amidase [Rhizobium sp. Root268]
MQLSEYQKLDGIALARIIHDREVTPVELMERAIEIGDGRAATLNALCYVDRERAIDAARSATPKGQFGALPFLLKDSGLASKTLPSSVGSRLFGAMKSSINATLNERFIEDGFISFGRTTVPEFCMAPTTEAVQNGGPTLNPWDEARSAGGSSGGAAVAVATSVVPIAHGSDGGGSIRIPAACCGVFGLKPSRGLVPIGPSRGEAWGGLAADGVLTRTVRDTAAALDGVVGMELGAPYAAPPVPGKYLDLLDQPFERPLRIAMWTTAFDDIKVADECVAAVEYTAGLLRSLGHEVVDVPFAPIKYSSFLRAHQDVLAASVTMTVNGMLRAKPDIDLRTSLEPAILDAYFIGKTLSAETYALAINRFHSITRQMEVYMVDYDFVLTPTLTQLPAPIGTHSMDTDFRTFRNAVGLYTTFLAIINASGQPAANVPVFWTEDGLPVGVQLVGRFGHEADLLKISAQLEEAAPWIGRYAHQFHA